LSRLRAALAPEWGATWEMVFALRAEEALTALRAAPVDVVVADLQVRARDDRPFLEVARDECPHAARIAFSARTDGPSVVQALRVAHRVVSKQSAPEVVAHVLQRACTLQDLVADQNLRGFMTRLTGLPAVPEIYAQLNAAIAQADTSFATIGRIVEQDPSLAAKLLQVVNSAHFALSAQVSRVEQAVALLGFETVRSLALSVHLMAQAGRVPAVPGFSLGLQQQHSLLAARIARRLLGGMESQHAFTAALLSDVGRVVFAMCLPRQLALTMSACREGTPLDEAERKHVGFSHAEVGAYLLGLWGLPPFILEAVAFHHVPSGLPLRGLDVLGATHAATVLTDEILSPIPGITCDPPSFDGKLLDILGDDDQVPAWRRLAEQEAHLPDEVR
jgi:HD-like signal output (HDOD) protein